MSIDRGLDPRDFALIAIGGAAPAHGCRLARMLGVRRVVVPPAAGVGSALGLLEGNETFELARTALLRLDRDDAAERVDAIFASLEQEALAAVGASWAAAGPAIRRTAGLRYTGQGYELEVGVDGGGVEGLAAAFNDLYERAYGYREQLPVEAVTWYLTVVRPTRARPAAAARNRGGRESRKTAREAYFPETGTVEVPVFDRLALSAGAAIEGPALLEEPHTTTVLLPGDTLRVDGHDALLITVGGDGA